MKSLGQIMKLLGNKDVKRMINDVRKAAHYLSGFAETYLGVYDDKGKQVEKGDRDYIFEKLDRAIALLEEISSKLDELLESRAE